MAANEAIASGNDLPTTNEEELLVEDEIDDGADGRNLIVNYIPQTYSENDLLGLFEPYGQIESCKIVSDYGFASFFCFVFVFCFLFFSLFLFVCFFLFFVFVN